MFEELKHAEYVHVLLNPLPVYATAMGVIALAVAFVLRSRPAQIVGLLIILIGTGSAWPVAEYGEGGYDRTYARADKAGQRWLDDHVHRANVGMNVFYVTAVVALAAMVLPARFPRSQLPMVAITLILALASLCVGAWISRAGGQVRHTEFRNGPPPLPTGMDH